MTTPTRCTPRIMPSLAIETRTQVAPKSSSSRVATYSASRREIEMASSQFGPQAVDHAR
ncbi:MAG: hypothetical protein IPJ27_07420 [Candidatus Accumulibacter sp.]|uniref:Uncharacterized protein n=1 Tax=Candidatus Accumulibacter proximus TaxID=2954385 RepID=A0A935UGM8_9PROT|nr:hypothetical protein [Candidatus Accumulibacter proximus]